MKLDEYDKVSERVYKLSTSQQAPAAQAVNEIAELSDQARLKMKIVPFSSNSLLRKEFREIMQLLKCCSEGMQIDFDQLERCVFEI